MSRASLPAKLLVVLVAAAPGIGCGDDYQTGGTETGEESGATRAQVSAVLSGVIDRDLNDSGYHENGFRDDPAVSQAFVAKVDRIVAENEKQGFPGLDFDPFICAQQLPRDFELSFEGPDGAGDAEVAGERATIIGRLDYGQQGGVVEVTYRMALEGGRWRLDSTDCLEQALNGR